MTFCRQQARDRVLLQMATLCLWIHQARLSLFKLCEQILQGVKAVLPPDSIVVCAHLSQALCTKVIHTCHSLLWSKRQVFCKISVFSPLCIHVLQCRQAASRRFWGLILQVFQKMNVLLNALFISANELCWEMLCIWTAPTISTSALCQRPCSRDLLRSADIRGSHEINYLALPGWQQTQQEKQHSP